MAPMVGYLRPCFPHVLSNASNVVRSRRARTPACYHLTAGPGILISFISDWHLNLRQRSWFEPPPFQRVGCHLIENLVACASCHRRAGNPAARGIDDQNANTATTYMGILRLVWIIGKRSINCHSF